MIVKEQEKHLERDQFILDKCIDLTNRIDRLSHKLEEIRTIRENELKEKSKLNNKLTSLFMTIPGALIVIDKTGSIQEVNKVAIEMFGDIKGISWADMIKTNFKEVEDSLEVVTKDGKILSLYTAELADKEGQIILLNDITKYSILKDKLNQRHRLSELGTMMGALAHQIRTPLSTAILYISHLSNVELTKEKIQCYAKKTKLRLNDLERLINDMLIFIKGETNKEYFFAKEILTEVKDQINQLAIENNCNVMIVDDIHSNIEIYGCKSSMKSSLLNLIVNSMQALQDKREIMIYCGSHDKNFIMKVSDTGSGIDASNIQKAVKPFFTTKVNGTGLGLAFVNLVVNSMHGKFSLKSENKKGAIATLTIPYVNRRLSL